jgi:hypothetical protein
MERLVYYSLVLFVPGFYQNICLWWLSVCWALEKLSISVHVIWVRRLKDRKAAVENEMRVASLFIDWLKKVSLITSWPFCLSISSRADQMQEADCGLITKSGMCPSGWNSWLPCYVVLGSNYWSAMLDVTYYSQPSQSRCHQEPCVYLGAGCPGMEVKKWPPNGGSRPVGWRPTQTCLVSSIFVQWTGELISMAFCVCVAYLDKHS